MVMYLCHTDTAENVLKIKVRENVELNPTNEGLDMKRLTTVSQSVSRVRLNV